MIALNGLAIAWAGGAAEAPGNGSRGLVGVLVLLGMVGLAYMITHYVLEGFQRRLLVVTGLEYVLLGALLGPAILPDVHVLGDLTALAPILAFGTGWVGLLYGMEMDPGAVSSLSGRAARLGFTSSLVTMVGITGVAFLCFSQGWLIDPVSVEEAWVAAGLLGTAAAAGSSSAVDVLQARYARAESQLLPLVGRASRLGDLDAIFGFGLIFCFYHQGTPAIERPLGPSDWVLITGALGLGLGALFAFFLGREEDENERFLALVGILVFASGAAFFLKVSALLVNLLLGFWIVRTAAGVGVRSALERSQGPVRLVLLVFAGALWSPVAVLPGLTLMLAYMGVRLAMTVLGSALATFGTPMRSDLFRGLLAQGDVALAMAIGFRLVYEGPAAELAYTAVLGAVVVHELVAPRVLKGLLVDAGELRGDVEWAEPQAAGQDRVAGAR